MVHPVEIEYQKGLVIYPTTRNMKVLDYAWEQENEKIVKSVELLENPLGEKRICFSYWKKQENGKYKRLPLRGATWYPKDLFRNLKPKIDEWVK